MSIRIDGTNTSANPGITGADTDTGLQFGTDEVSIVTGGSERVKVDSSGRVAIGTTTPGEGTADNLTIADSGHCGITLRSGSSEVGSVFFSDGTSGTAQYKGYVQYDHNGDFLKLATAGTEKMRIHSDGEVTKPFQPAFMAALNASLNVFSGIGKIRTRFTTNGDYYTNVMTNVGSCWSTANTRFTAPVDGIYWFSSQIATDSVFPANAYLGVEFYKNSSRISTGWRRSSGAGYQRVTANILLPLSEGDFVEPGIETAQAGALLGGTTLITQYTHFLGYLVS